MKEFLKWLGVNEKIAKIVVWILIAMIVLIVINTTLESIGLPFYKITAENIGKIIKSPKLIEYMISWAIAWLNFCSIIFLVFRIKEFKKIFPYSILFIVIQIIVEVILKCNYVISQISIVSFLLIFCYLYSNKKIKYIFYGIISFVINTIIQGICYMYKVRFIDFEKMSQALKGILGIDFFIIMLVVILVKEIYLKKRGEKDDSQLAMVGNIRQRKESSKQNSKKINKKR